ncbi:trihelix transcription factor GTL2 [Manihot esculenta]|uniref:Myb-like domain-containing protein n=1 Tax=Manihot esculenta TaxID=3983 RepID=A0A2C9VHJ9_MANES|nr:trihelix transcription factor GTL2 [Manihot esculenta]OAY44220.1 hypothetical protein MANES_08G132700v8 [Manihot esculenta]
MFEGVPDQFHQFIASRTSLPLPHSFSPLHGSSSTSTATFSSFDPYTSHHQQLPLHHHHHHHHQQQHHQQPNFLHPLHQSSPPASKNEDKEESNMAAINLEIVRERSLQESIDPWSNDEVLALLRIRSSMENWFPEFTWEHVSRKLAELGFKRSAEKCKEKFEEESRYFNNINCSKNYRVFVELEEIYHGDNQNPQGMAVGKNKKMDEAAEEEDKMEQNVEEDSRIDQTVGNPSEGNGKGVEKSKNKKRKRQKKFDMFKCFCEDIISKIMAQQEEMHNKLLEDMVKRDEEKLAREEAWKKQEMDRINKELELRAQEQALEGDRQEKIINFLKKFSSSTGSCIEILREVNAQYLLKGTNSSNPSSSSSLMLQQNPNPTSQTNDQNKPETPISITIGLTSLMPENVASLNPSSTLGASSSPSSQAPQTQNSNYPNFQSNPLSTETVQKKATSNDKEDLGKRWPKDEVLALINLRSNLYNSNEDKETTVKAPLWERISQGMSELGYKRSAKRCKEKWENINKYFRKTKDVNKKRSVDSRTCPYFDQLNTLYNQGTLIIAPSSDQGPQKLRLPASPEKHSAYNTLMSSSQNGYANSTLHNVGDEGEKNLVHDQPALDFEF